MDSFKRIRKLNEEKAEKHFALTQLATRKTSNNSDSSFINKDQKGQSDSQGQQKGGEEEAIYWIKNLDENKIQIIDKDCKVDKIIENLNTLPEITQLVQKIWQQYSSDYQKQEEVFLQACYQGNIQIVQKVVASKNKHPIDPKNAMTDQGKNGIHLATISGSYRNIQIISVLIKCGVDINGLTHNQKRTPLMLGSILGNQIAVKALIELGAQPDLQDYQGNTALHLACGYNQQKVVEILLDKCSTQILNKKGQKPIQCIANVRQKPNNNQKFKVASKKDEYNQLLDNMRESHDSRIKNTRNEKMNQIPINQIKQIGLSSFKKLSILGRGAFGEVYLVQNVQDGKKYAMKVLDKAMIMRQNILRYAMTERKILSTINHPFVVRLHYALQSTQKLYLVMQYCPGGDILRLIKRKGKLQQEQTRKYTAEIILAIEQLHKAQIIYRDLKPGNVVLDPDGHACLTDFGLSKQASISHSFCGSTAYLAPEMLWRRGHTKVLDWYLLGVFIYECLTGRPPFWDTNKQQLLANIKSGRYKQLGLQFSKQVKDLVENLLKSNSSKRLGVKGAAQIKCHPWFKSINWAIVQKKGLIMNQIDPIQGKQIAQQNFQDQDCVQNKVNGWDFSTTSP